MSDDIKSTLKLIPYTTWPHDAGKIGWFDPASPTESWRGVEQYDEAGLYKGFWQLFRTHDGIWISCFGFDQDRPFIRKGIGQEFAHWQVLPKGAETWFAKNGQSPPAILFRDLEAGEAATEKEPFVPCAPNGVLFAYGNLNAAKKIDVDAMAVDHVAEARRVDPMPDPEKITVGEIIDFITLIARMPQSWLALPVHAQQYLDRSSVLSASPGFREFRKWCQRKHGRDSSLELAEGFRAELCKRIDGDFDDVNPLPLLDAVRLVGQPETATPSPPPRKVENGAIETGPLFLTWPELRPAPPREDKKPDRPAELPDLVTLDQAAGAVHKSKRTLERYKTKGTLPKPAVEGGGGKADLYDWKVVGPWLTKVFGMMLPDRYFGH